MPDNAFLKHFFSSDPRLVNEEDFGFTRKSRKVRLREIFAILRRNDVINGVTPEQFRSVLEELGPSFVKIGQVLSTRSEILPEAYCDELAMLQSFPITVWLPITLFPVMTVLSPIYTGGIILTSLPINTFSPIPGP